MKEFKEMAIWDLNSENKQHINLSDRAMFVIQNDMQAFRIENKSSFINKILTNFCFQAQSTLSSSLDRFRADMEAKLGMKNVVDTQNFIKAMEEDYVDSIRHKQASYGKGNSFKIRINKQNREYLFDDCDEMDNYETAGDYIKALIEEYAEMDFKDRERIYAADRFEVIEKAINEEKTISLETRDGKKVKVRPYGIFTDPLSMYHYLVGMKIRKNANGPVDKSEFSCRISNLKKEIRCLKENGFLSKDDKKTLERAIREKGVQFLNDNTDNIKIYMTDRGISMYERILHLRPSVSQVDEDGHLYTFHCSQRQIEYYFLKFGGEAVVLSPPELKERFMKKYEEALKAYEMYD